ncbi:MAG: GNAT family N-acetyltransferase [Clostridiaceae bacterium]|jgi:N-acetylglutamate synthase-like GNAT family acetyltransferase|nr:GNAT family N-acetyltransferase [Clostridiaceae bacterium]
MMQIRKIKPEDIGFVIDITSRYGFTKGKLLSNIEGFLICEDYNVKCGCGCMVPFKGKGYISWVIVSEDHRRKKLGSAITKALLNIADQQGIKEVYAAGNCEGFLTALGFGKQDINAVKDDFITAIGDTSASEYYRVSLEGYFKPCSSDKTHNICNK